jgi:hypothetical protein
MWYRFGASVPDLHTLLTWTRLEDPAARADAAHQLRKHAADPGCPETVRTALAQLVADTDPEVARIAVSSLLSASTVDPMLCVRGLASPHEDVRTTCRTKLEGMHLTWPELAKLGLDGAQGITFVSTEELVCAVVSAEAWRDLATDELAQRDLTDVALADLQILEAALERSGRDAAWLSAHLAAKRKEAISHRRAPRAKGTKYLSDFIADVASENIDGADDYVFMLTSGDWAALPAELARMESELQAMTLDKIGHGPARGLFVLLDHLEASTLASRQRPSPRCASGSQARSRSRPRSSRSSNSSCPTSWNRSLSTLDAEHATVGCRSRSDNDIPTNVTRSGMIAPALTCRLSGGDNGDRTQTRQIFLAREIGSAIALQPAEEAARANRRSLPQTA